MNGAAKVRQVLAALLRIGFTVTEQAGASQARTRRVGAMHIRVPRPAGDRAEAGLVCTALEHFVRIVVGPLADEKATLRPLTREGSR